MGQHRKIHGLFDIPIREGPLGRPLSYIAQEHQNRLLYVNLTSRMSLKTPCPYCWSHTTAETYFVIDYSLAFHNNLTLKNHTTADRVGASYACCLLLLPFKSHSDFLNIQLSFWETAEVERPLFILRPKKPKMPDVWVDVLGKGTRNDAAKIMSSFSPFLSLIISLITQ